MTLGSDTVTGGKGSGSAVVTAKSPLTVAANVVMGGVVVLTAGELADGPTFADDLTVNGGITVKSTTAAVLLQAGDDVILGAGSLVEASNPGQTILLAAGAGDLDSSAPLSARRGIPSAQRMWR